MQLKKLDCSGRRTGVEQVTRPHLVNIITTAVAVCYFGIQRRAGKIVLIIDIKAQHPATNPWRVLHPHIYFPQADNLSIVVRPAMVAIDPIPAGKTLNRHLGNRARAIVYFDNISNLTTSDVRPAKVKVRPDP